MASRSTNTMSEFLQRMLGDLAEAKTLPDADLQFLIQLETTILQKLRAPIDALMGQMNNGQGGQQIPQTPGGGGMPGGTPGGAAGLAGMQGGLDPQMLPQPAPAGRVTGTRMEAPMPNVDELRRMMGGAQG